MKDVTLILQQIQNGQGQVSQDLFPAVYEELRRLAEGKMSQERADHTLSATALVHEAYVRLVDVEAAKCWENRAHFFAAAAEAMRRILVDHARRKLAVKRGGDIKRREGFGDLSVMPVDAGTLVDLNDAIDKLAETDEQSAELLKLLLFAGLSVAEAGRLLGFSRKVAYRHWNYIRSWFAVNYGEPTS